MKEYLDILVLGFICCLIILYLYNDRRISKFKIAGSTAFNVINEDIYIRYKTSRGLRCAIVTDNALLLSLKKSIIQKLWEALLKFEDNDVSIELTIVTPDKSIVVFRDGEIHEYAIMQ